MKPHPWLDRTLMYCSLHYTLCLTEDAFKRVLKHLSVAPEETPPFVSNWHSNATTHHFEHRESSKKSAVICLRGWEDKTGVQIACLLVHEAVHIWQEHCLDIGEHKPGAEQEAYAIQNIAQTLMESFVEQSK
jgi:hypothetical protein